MNSKKSNCPIHADRGIAFTDKRKAEAFAYCLELLFCPNENPDDDIDWEEVVENAYEDLVSRNDGPVIPVCTDAEIINIIKDLKVKKASGEDGYQ